MALMMEPGSEPLTEGQKADLEGIAAIKESAAREYKEQGNQFLKMGRKHYTDAVDCYTKAIAQMEPLSTSAPNPDASVLFANRAHVNLLLGNHRRALDDAEQAVRLSPSNVKAHYRAAKAALALDLLPEAASFCRRGLEQGPANEELKKFLAQVDAQQREQDRQRAKVAQAVSAAKDLSAAIEKRGLRLGKAAYQELTGVKKPKLDEQGVLHWPVLLLYPEVMSSDFIEDFPETDLFSPHLDVMFSASSPPLPWDESHAYTREAIELYYQAGVGTPLSKGEILKYFLEGTVDSRSLPESLLDGEDGEHDTGKGSTGTSSSEGSGKWIKVKEGKTLQEAQQHKDYIIPARQRREVAEEKQVSVDQEHLDFFNSLNSEQLAGFNDVMDHVNNGKSQIFFVDGPGGTGKTYLYKALLAKVRSKGLIAITTATSGIAASIMPGGRTAHSRFKISIKLNDNSMCGFTKQSGTSELLRQASLII